MGQKQCKVPRAILPEQMEVREWVIKKTTTTTTVVHEDVKTLESFSNPSLVTVPTDEQQTKKLGSIFQLNEDDLDNLIFVYKSRIPDKNTDFIYKNTIVSIEEFIDKINTDENLCTLMQKINETRLDDTWASIFASCAVRNSSSTYKYLSIDQRLIVHVISVIRTLAVIVDKLRDGDTGYVQKMCELIALSHQIMKVSQPYFKMLCVRLTRILLSTKMIPDDAVEPFLYFYDALSKKITKKMSEITALHYKRVNFMMDDTNAPSRQYYRELKWWLSFTSELSSKLTAPLQLLQLGLESHRPSKLLLINTDNKTEQVSAVDNIINGGGKGTQHAEQSKFIRFLKRGFKHKLLRNFNERI